MSFRRHPEDQSYPEFPDVEPVAAGDIPGIVDEFCARNAGRPDLATFDNDTGACFALGEAESSAIFVLEVSARSMNFCSGIDFEHTTGSRERLAELFTCLASRISFGSLKVTEDGAQWSWDNPALHYPWFHSNAMHAIAYAEYLADKLWPVARQVAEGSLQVAKAVAHLQSEDQ